MEVCADRRCTSVVAAFDATGTSAQAPASLARGTFWWRLTALVGATHISADLHQIFLAVGGGDVPLLAPGFTSRGLIPSPLADLNGDGYTDLAVCWPDDFDLPGGVNLYAGSAAGLNRATGGAWRLDGSTCPGSLGDVNGDGRDDYRLGGVVVFGDRPELSTSVTPQGGPAGDLNADGYDDLLSYSHTTSTVTVQFGSAAGPGSVVTVVP